MAFYRPAEGFKAGDFKAHGRAALPAGWLWCDGSAVSRTTYAALFAAIGTAFGAGDGVNTFNVPDFRGRAPFGRDDMGGVAASRLTSAGSGVAGATLGAAGGAQNVTLDGNTTGLHAHSFTSQAVGSSGGQNIGSAAAPAVTIAGPSSTNNGGGGQAHNNVPPALVCNVIVKA